MHTEGPIETCTSRRPAVLLLAGPPKLYNSRQTETTASNGERYWESTSASSGESTPPRRHQASGGAVDHSAVSNVRPQNAFRTHPNAQHGVHAGTVIRAHSSVTLPSVRSVAAESEESARPPPPLNAAPAPTPRHNPAGLAGSSPPRSKLPAAMAPSHPGQLAFTGAQWPTRCRLSATHTGSPVAGDLRSVVHLRTPHNGSCPRLAAHRAKQSMPSVPRAVRRAKRQHLTFAAAWHRSDGSAGGAGSRGQPRGSDQSGARRAGPRRARSAAGAVRRGQVRPPSC